MNITREQVIAWAREVYGDDESKPFHESALLHLERLCALAYAAGVAAECDKFNKERQQYADWFDEAAADIYDWGGYASGYFQEKYDLEANVQDFKNRAAAIRARGNK